MFGTFQVRTIHDTLLAADTAKGEIIHARAETISLTRPLVFVHLTRRCLGRAFFLVDDNFLRPVAPRHTPPSSAVPVLRCQQLAVPELYAFRHPQQGTSLLAHDLITPDGIGMIALHGHNIGPWEHFKLIEPPAELPIGIRYQTSLIQRVLDTSVFAIPRLLREASLSERPLLSSLLANTMSTETAEVLGGYLLAEPQRLTEFVALLGDDPWASVALPALKRFVDQRTVKNTDANSGQQSHAWRSVTSGTVVQAPAPMAILPRPGFLSRLLTAEPARPEAPRAEHITTSRKPDYAVIGPELDCLANDGSEGNYVSVAHICAAMARRTVPPVRDLCIVATLRDEGAYVLDWLAYHRSVGVDRVFVYTNNNTDGSETLLRALAAADEITLVENQVSANGNPQGKAYGHALGVAPDVLDYRWCAIIDVDEFLGFEKPVFSSLKEYLCWQELAPVDAIALSWNMVTSSHAIRWHDVPLPSRFRERCAGPDLHIKTIFRPRLFHHSTPHVPMTDGQRVMTCRDAVGELHTMPSPFARAPRDTHAWIAHYFYRSVEEYVWKWSRGRGDDALSTTMPAINIPEDFIGAFLKQFRDSTHVSDERMVSCAEGLSAERDRLLRLPGVAAARAAVITYYRERSAALGGVLREMRSSASPVAAEFYDLLLETQGA